MDHVIYAGAKELTITSGSKFPQLPPYAAGLDPNPLVGVEDGLRNCAIPVRIVWGKADTIFSAKSPDYLDHIFPKSCGVRRVPDAKLFFPEEMPDLIAEEAARLWRITTERECHVL